MLAGGEDGKLWAWNVLDAKPLGGFPQSPHRKAISSVLCNPNGREMVTASLGKCWHMAEADGRRNDQDLEHLALNAGEQTRREELCHTARAIGRNCKLASRFGADLQNM